MGPLITAGLSLVQGDFSLFKRSLGVAFIGIGIGFTASFIFGALYPGFEPTLEIEARGEPDLLDLGIAVFSGMTAAYALGRSKVIMSFAGVAIAAALVPPLAVVGIALSHGQPLISGNAAILLITNLVAIILAAAVVFRMLKLHVPAHGSDMHIWVRRTTITLFLVLILLVAPLLIHMIEKRRTGHNRPTQYLLAPHVRKAVKEYIDEWPEVELITQGRKSVEPEAGITIILMSTKNLPLEFEDGLIKAVHRARGGEATVRVFPVLTARQRPAEREGMKK
jgi:uncharacterized hydrophobic protein (TIGR00271 family)